MIEEEKNIGVSLTKTIEEGEILAANIDRGIKVAREKNTLEAVEKVAKKIDNFYENIKDTKLSGNNRKKVISILKIVRSALPELNNLKTSIINEKAAVSLPR